MNKIDLKVRLVAIAKDEGAYLPEWIYYHLSLGVDSIVIYTNGITDNSSEIIRRISRKYPQVKEINADYLVDDGPESFQKKAYRSALDNAKKDNFDYLMWLDIDEFWVSRAFNRSIKDYIYGLNKPDFLVFPWGIRVGEVDEFGASIAAENYIRMDKHVKPIFKVSLEIEGISPHCVITPNSVSLLPCGDALANRGEDVPIMPVKYTEIPRAFILHRVSRTPREYISLLGRGRPYSKGAMAAIKDNRWGYLKFESYDKVWGVESHKYQQYTFELNSFISECELNEEIIKSKEFILKRFKDMVLLIQSEYLRDPNKIKVLLNNVELNEFDFIKDEE